jgi:hypothetical protein
MDFFVNPVGFRKSPAKYYVFCYFNKEVVQKLKFPNNINT